MKWILSWSWSGRKLASQKLSHKLSQLLPESYRHLSIALSPLLSQLRPNNLWSGSYRGVDLVESLNHKNYHNFYRKSYRQLSIALSQFLSKSYRQCFNRTIQKLAFVENWSDWWELVRFVEIDQICGKLIRFDGNWSDLWTMVRFVQNWSDLWKTDQICGNWFNLWRT